MKPLMSLALALASTNALASGPDCLDFNDHVVYFEKKKPSAVYTRGMHCSQYSYGSDTSATATLGFVDNLKAETARIRDCEQIAELTKTSLNENGKPAIGFEFLVLTYAYTASDEYCELKPSPESYGCRYEFRATGKPITFHGGIEYASQPTMQQCEDLLRTGNFKLNAE